MNHIFQSPFDRLKTDAVRVLALIIVSVLCFTNLLISQEIRIDHIYSPFVNQNKGIHIDASIDAMNVSIESAMIHYKQSTDEVYRNVEMRVENRQIRGVIPSESVVPPSVEYYLSIVFSDGSEINYPTRAPAGNTPITVTVRPAEAMSAASEGVLIISPEPDLSVEAEEALIAVSFLKPLSNEQIENIRVELDGKKINSLGYISEEIISIVVENIQPGNHFVNITTIEDGQRVKIVDWAFSTPGIEGKADWEFPVHGSITGGYNHEDIVSKVNNNTYLNSRFYGETGELNWSANAYVTSRERGDQQPYNRFLATLEYGAFALRGGDVKSRLSEFTLWGVRTRGGEFKIDSRYFIFDAVYGQSRRSIEGFGVLVATIATDPETGDTLKSEINPMQDSILVETDIIDRGTFQRNLLGLKTGINFAKNVNLSFNFLKVKDQTGSIRYGVKPKDNLVFGFDAHAYLHNHRIRFTTETAISMYNDNISSGPMSDAEDFESIIVVNQYFQPLPTDEEILEEDIGATKLIGKVFDELLTSSLAHRTGLTLNYFNNELRLGYKTIGKSFQSLGSPAVIKDVAGFYIDDRFRLLDKRLYLTLGYEDYNNNVNGREQRTQDKKILRGGVAYYSPPEYPNINIGVRSLNRANDGEVEVTRLSETDSIVIDDRIDYETTMFSVGVDQHFRYAGFNHTATIFYSADQSQDQFNSSLGTNIDAVNFTLNSRLRNLLDLNFAYNFSSQEALGGSNATDFNTFSINAKYMLLRNVLWVSAGVNNSTTKGTLKDVNPVPAPENNDAVVRQLNTDYNRTRLTLGSEFKYDSHHTVTMQTYYYMKSDNGSIEYFSGRTEPNINEYNEKDDFVFRIRYEYVF